MKNPYYISLILISFIISACNIGVDAPQDPSVLSTAAALTVEAALSQPAPLASPTAGAQVTATATATRIPGVAIDGTTAEPTQCAENVEIVTWTRDGKTYDKAAVDTLLPPGKGFVMSWAFKNTGSCVWNDKYKMIFDSGERLTEADSFAAMPFGYTVQPGETLTVTIQMSAPSAPGTYESTFKLIDPQGKHVVIPGVITKVGTPSSGSIAAPGDLRYEYSCVPGLVTISLKWKDKSDNEDGFRIYRDGTKVTDLPAGSTAYDDLLSTPGSYSYAVAAFNSSGESPANVTAETTNCQ